MMTLLEDRISTPLGQLIIVSDEQQNLRAVEWEEFGARMNRLLNIHYGAQGYRLRQLDNAGGLSAQLTRYFEGDLSVITQLAVATNGTEFQRSVWNMLRTIPCGSVLRYGEMAAMLGRAGAARAVGAANGSNPISVVVPCHRVIGANGTLTGYAGGVSRKQWLLQHEGYRPG
ncbi:methylated-DNA--[protein]-cysteine S-methyltransferase [Pantoea sp. B65]|uniref:methylated-DNA--[protein]-cysteine S-methyltransferase n=1 Tax=Pantoea sp. B65 TaxID=2813359 RepID=UPI0039B53816